MRIVPILLLCLSFNASAEMYKWVDANGINHYSNKPHDGAEQLLLLTKDMIGLPVTAPDAKVKNNKITPSVAKKSNKKPTIAASNDIDGVKKKLNKNKVRPLH